MVGACATCTPNSRATRVNELAAERGITRVKDKGYVGKLKS
jgi:hypothetical protein